MASRTKPIEKPSSTGAKPVKKNGNMVVMNRHGELIVVDDTGREREHNRLVYGAELKVREGERVETWAKVA